MRRSDDPPECPRCGNMVVDTYNAGEDDEFYECQNVACKNVWHEDSTPKEDAV